MVVAFISFETNICKQVLHMNGTVWVFLKFGLCDVEYLAYILNHLPGSWYRAISPEPVNLTVAEPGRISKYVINILKVKFQINLGNKCGQFREPNPTSILFDFLPYFIITGSAQTYPLNTFEESKMPYKVSLY